MRFAGITKKSMIALLFAAAAFAISCAKKDVPKPLYLDTSYSFEERAADLVSRLTIEEKQSLLGNTMAAVPRLGINTYYVWGEALHGVVPMFNPYAGKATSFPGSAALSASWDPELMEKEAVAISDEARAFNNPVIATLTYWSPVVEPVRDPRWGRTAETYGEDPFLISRIGSGFVRGIMGDDPVYLKAVPCGKHYFANNSEFNRHISSSDMDDRDMREFYLVPYKYLIEKDKLPSIMTCYNAVNGIPMSANRYLVDTIPRRTYGLNGYITGDCGAIQDIQTGHLFAKTAAEAAAYGLRSGVDTDCGSVYQTSTIDALGQGLITEAEIDRALLNMFTIRMRVGEFDPPSSVPWSSIDSSVVNCSEHIALAAEVAKRTPVLLKNSKMNNSDKKILPLDHSNLKKIALIGPQADKVELGPYSGTPFEENLITPLEGIRSYLAEKQAAASVEYLAGANTVSNANLFNIYWFEVVRSDGSTVRYGTDRITSTSKGITIGGGMLPVESVKSIVDGSWIAFKNVDLTGVESINLNLGIPGDGGRIEFRTGSPSGELIATIDGMGNTGMYSTFMPGTKNARTEKPGLSGSANIFMVFRSPEKPAIDNAAIDLAKSSDVVVLFVGTDDKTSNEEADRLTLELPGNQYELIDAVAAVNPNTVVVMQTHGMVETDRFRDNPNIAGIIWTSFNGQAQGTAIASILFGETNPGGKLNATWFRSMNDLPPITDYELRGGKGKNGRTHWYFRKDVSYEFGFGLSYTTFEYSNFRIDRNEVTPNDKIVVSADVRNTGSIDGDEVVQVYLRTPDSPASLDRPLRRLEGFQRVTIPAGQTKTVDIAIDCADLWFWDSENDRMTFDQGRYVFGIGSSSKDIRGEVETVMSGTLKPVLKTVVADCGKVVLKPGDKVRTSVTAAMSDDSFHDPGNAGIAYTSSNPGVATVNETGEVTAVAAGVATITAEVSIDGTTVSDGYPIKVMADLTLAGISLDGENINGFNPGTCSYSRLMESAKAKIPSVSAEPAVAGTKIRIAQAKTIPGTAVITLSDDITGQTGIYTVNFGISSESDAFEASGLKDKWSWIRENKELWSLSDSPDNLVLTGADGDIKGRANNASNILLQSANADWVIETSMKFSKRPSKEDQQGGLIAYQDDDNYVKLVYTNSRKGFMGTSEYIELLVESEGAEYSAANARAIGIIPDDLKLSLRLEKEGSIFTAWYSVGGNDFRLLGTTEAFLKDAKAGLIVCNGAEPQVSNMVAQMMGIGGAAAQEPFKVGFDYFNVENTGK